MVIYQITFNKQDFFNFHFKLSSKIFIIISTILFLVCVPWSYSFDGNTVGFSYSDKTFSVTGQPNHAPVLVAQSTRRARNKRPTLNLVANPSTGQSPLYVTFDANASDPDGYIVQYRWDYDGNGTVDETTTSNSGEFIYIIPGTYYAKVKVIDNRQGSASDSATVTVSSPPQPTPTPTPNPTTTPTPTPTSTSEPTGPAFYISPTGSDSNIGTSDRPWKTFAFAIPKLRPGDTLILKNGTYTKTTTGLPYINCASNARNGSAVSPITVKAENERQALLKSDGSLAALFISYCSYWNIDGLRAKSADLNAANGGKQNSVVEIRDSNHITVRRGLFTHPNRYFNTHTLAFANVNNSLIEETEVYYFHRFGIIDSQGSDNLVRRSYAHSRSYGDLADGYNSIDSSTGDSCIGAYATPSVNKTRHMIIENSIGEDCLNGVSAGGANPNDGIFAKNLGNISLYGLSNGAFENGNASNVLFENVVLIQGNNYGLFERGSYNVIANNSTFYGNAADGVQADVGSNATVAYNSIYLTNLLSSSNSGRGFGISEQDGWLIDYSNAYRNSGGNYSPSETINDNLGKIRNSLSVAPSLMGLGTNQCIVYVPGGHDGRGGTNPQIGGKSSNMAGAGKNGNDIGANIVYRYHDGKLTDEKLWDQTTGKFPCGATVNSVNDDASFPDSSCINVHKRLNVGVDGCPIP